jgi:hypothetical protein
MLCLSCTLIAGKGCADHEVVAATGANDRLVTEAAAVGTPFHFFRPLRALDL